MKGTALKPLLYLDTARLGQMTPAAKRAQLDFVRLTAEEPSSLYFERFLREGFASWPSAYQRRFPGLDTWSGMMGLASSLRRLLQSTDGEVVLASRSLALVQMAARSLFRTCRNLLTTDLSWPTYQRALTTRAKRTGCRITLVKLRKRILRQAWTVDQVADELARVFVEQRCDGLFLPAVDHLGIRVPVREIVTRIKQIAELKFCLIDAAQAFCQVPLGDSIACADFVVAGGHKWLGAYLPLGIGLFGHSRSRKLIQQQLVHEREQTSQADPLLRFTNNLTHGALTRYSETVNLAPLFASAGASADQLAIGAVESNQLGATDCKLFESLQLPCGYVQMLSQCPEFYSRIMLFKPRLASLRKLSSDATRRRWLDTGYVVSSYSLGLVRVSLPPRPASGGINAPPSLRIVSELMSD